MYNSYADMQKEIELIKIRLECYNTQKTLLTELMYAFTSPVRELKGMVYSDMPGGSSTVDYSRYVEGMRILETKIEIENRILKNMLETSKKIDDKVNEFEGIEFKVAYMKNKGMKLDDIADELSYTQEYIRKVSADLKRERV